MRPKVFVVQPIPQAPLEVLQEVADVEVFENLRRQISLEETIEAARRSNYLVALHGVADRVDHRAAGADVANSEGP